MDPHPKVAQMLPLLTFILGEQHYAFMVEDVVEVAAMVELTSVPDARPEIIGVANRHNDVLPILDLRLIMNCEASPIDEGTLFIVTNYQEQMIGFVVDDIEQVEYIPTEQLRQSSTAGKYIRGIISYKQRLIQVVELAPLMALYSPDAVTDDLLKVDS